MPSHEEPGITLPPSGARVASSPGVAGSANPDAAVPFVFGRRIAKGGMGAILGKHKVNIANMSLSRNVEGGTALTLLTLDSTPNEEVLSDIRKIEGVKNIHCVLVE